MEVKSNGSRAPRGARGLKYLCNRIGWFCRRRAPRGARGLKSKQSGRVFRYVGRAPRGARGLKLTMPLLLSGLLLVAPLAGRVD